VYVGGASPLTFGGTSAVAPLWAALTALLTASLGHPVGDLNAQLYPLVGTTALRDITQGTNGGYSAKVGWDAVTGCGTPVGQELLTKFGQPASSTTTQITVRACDNELIIMASNGTGSSTLCHLKSGYNAPVSYVFNPQNILAAGQYDLTLIGINWGGPGNFTVDVTTGGATTTLQGSGSATGVVFSKTIPMSI
jgi:subtilase family serine protease